MGPPTAAASRHTGKRMGGNKEVWPGRLGGSQATVGTAAGSAEAEKTGLA